MEVRRNTRTAPVAGTRGFQQAQSLDTSGIQQGLDAIKATVDATRRENQQFNLQKRMLEESNALEADLEQRRRDPNIDIDNFSQVVDSDYTDRVNTVSDEFIKEGYDPDLVKDFTLGMGQLRNSLTDTATSYQQQALTERAASQVNTLLEEGSRQVVTNVDNYETARSFIEDTIGLNPYLSEEQRTKLRDSVGPSLRAAAAQSMVMENPQFVLDQLDPDKRWLEQREAPVTGSAASVVSQGFDMESYLPKNEHAESGGNNKAKARTSSAYGPHQFLRDTWIEYYGKTFGNTGESRGDILEKRSDLETSRKVMEAFTQDNLKALEAAGAPVDNGTAYLAHFLGRGDAVRVLGANPDTPVAQVVNNASIAANRSVFKKAKTAGELVAWAREKMGVNADLVGEPERVPQEGDVTLVDIPASTAGQTVNQSREMFDAEAVEPLHPVLRDLTGPERLRLLSEADKVTQQKTAEQRAAMDILIDNAKAEALQNGAPAGVVPSEEEVLQAYGNVRGPQVYSDMQQTFALGKQLQDYAVMPPEKMAQQVESLRPVQGSPTFATDARLFEAAQRAQAQILDERNADPAAYVLKNFPSVSTAAQRGTPEYYAAMDRALETLGFDPQAVSPLPESAANSIISSWPQKSPSARRKWFQENFQTMGEDRLAHFARNAEGTEMEEELRMYAFARNRVSSATMDQVFAGRDAIKEDPARRPSSEKVTELFRRSAFGAVQSMDPRASSALQEIAASLYVAKGGDAGTLNRTIYEEALSQALGGSVPVNLGKGEANVQTILPPKVSESQFTNWLETREPGDLTRMSREGTQPLYGDLRTTVKLNDIIDDGVFVMLSPDSYGIRMASDGGYLKTATGRNFVVRIRTKDVR